MKESHSPGGWAQVCRHCSRLYWVSYIPSTRHTKKFELDDKEKSHPCYAEHNKAILIEQSRIQGD